MAILLFKPQGYPNNNKQDFLLMKLFTLGNRFSTLRKLLKQELIPQKKDQLLKLRKEHGNKVIGQVKVDDAVLGMRGLPVMFYDGSALDNMKGITFHGLSIPEFQRQAQKAKGGHEPLPESMFWLLMTGRMPSDAEFNELESEWREKGKLLDEEVKFILNLPNQIHPMTMLSMALLYLQKNSEFFKAYQQGVHKSKYWELYFEDSMNLLAKLPRICAVIYRHKYKNSKLIEANDNLDWAGNFAHMLGYEQEDMRECMRGYLSIHSDHEGGNVSAHACHLIGSALADPYLSYSGALNGLAGPLHGLANQECLKWLISLKEHHNGKQPSKSVIEEFVQKTLDSGRVIPGYGHAVLRNTDPRFLHLKEFADRNIKDDYICDLSKLCFETIPGVLGKVGKIKNPYPNVDAYSGCLLQHYGMKQYDFYTAVFAVSRALGCLSNGVWSRAFGLPIERPNSINLSYLEKL